MYFMKLTYQVFFNQVFFFFKWNLVCDRRWMGAVAQTSYMFGVFTGAVLLGSMADKYVVNQ